MINMIGYTKAGFNQMCNTGTGPEIIGKPCSLGAFQKSTFQQLFCLHIKSRGAARIVQFHAASLNFKSTSYQWLVVSGSKATYKGNGTINGGGNYGFLLSAIDGSPDKFRIKIWAVGGAAVYDNNLGGGEDADPATALADGSIVIHTGKK